MCGGVRCHLVAVEVDRVGIVHEGAREEGMVNNTKNTFNPVTVNKKTLCTDVAVTCVSP